MEDLTGYAFLKSQLATLMKCMVHMCSCFATSATFRPMAVVSLLQGNQGTNNQGAGNAGLANQGQGNSGVGNQVGLAFCGLIAHKGLLEIADVF